MEEEARTDARMEVPSFDIFIDEEKVEDGAFQLLAEIRPSWSPDQVSFKTFTDGITNKLIGCWTKKSPKEIILIRMYGKNTDLLIDRKAETRNFKLLQKAGFAPQLYAIFGNGLAYEYIHGEILTVETVRAPSIYPLVATMLAKIHKINNQDSQKPILWDLMKQYLKLVPETFSNPEKQRLYSEKFPDGIEVLHSEMLFFEEKLSHSSSKVVFCHNDLLLANIIHDQGKVTFIDYEYAGCNYQAYDIGNHFTEFAGVSSVDYSNYPSPDFQHAWLKIYLQEFNSNGNSTARVTNEEIKELYIQVNKFALVTHLLWATWALVQAELSSIDFDFISYAATRMEELFCKKEKILSLDAL
ncbi:ethanolamine kinase 1 isoform X1 [Halyomorpha halys]|uniref:ethanolamine kinase 1 isoform X1 n=3 Tax=Halyomorpha halys TaxID=286706 RepID=UPI0034D3299E